LKALNAGIGAATPKAGGKAPAWRVIGEETVTGDAANEPEEGKLLAKNDFGGAVLGDASARDGDVLMGVP